VVGMASIVFSASANTRLQLAAPDELRGRVMSLYFLLFAGTTPIGGMLVGLTAARFGVQPMVVMLGTVCAAGVACAALLGRRRDAASVPAAHAVQ